MASLSEQGERRLACLICRQRKVACDGRRPKCGLCQKNDFDCQYKSRQHKPGLRAGYVARLEERLNSVEGRLRHVEAELASNSSPGRRHASPLPRPALSPDRTDATLIVEAGQQIGLVGDVRDHNTSPRGNHSDLASSMAETPRTAMDTFAADLPRPVADSLIDNWYREYYPWFPIVHRTSLHGISTGSQYEVVRNAIVVVMMAHDGEIPYLRRGMAEGLRSEIMHQAMNSSSLQSVQALLILTNYYYAEGNLTMFWNVLAMCKKMAMLLNLHVKAAAIPWAHGPGPQARSLVSSSDVEREEGISTFWMIELLDSISTLGLLNSVPMLKVPPAAHLPLPESAWAMCEPVDLAAKQPRISSSFSLCVIMAVEQLGAVHQFLHLSYNLKNLEQRLEWQSEAQRIDDGLTMWREEFVATVFQVLNAEKDRMPRGEMDPFVTLTNCVLNTAIIVLLQKMAPFPQQIGRDFEPWAFATNRCVYACENMAAKIRRIGPDELDSHSPHLILPVFTAARFYIAYSKALDADVPADLRSLAFNLHICGKRWPLAQRYEAIIRTAVGEHRSPISECMLPVEFYDLRYSTLEIAALLQATAEKLVSSPNAVGDMDMGGNEAFF